MKEERKHNDLIDDIEDTLCSCPESFIREVYRMVVGKEPQVRNNIEIIMEVLSEVDEEFFCLVYKKVTNKNCEYSENEDKYYIS